MSRKIYLIGSLTNPRVREIGQELRLAGHLVFDDWHAAGPDADRQWERYERSRGRTMPEALRSSFAEHAFHYDRAFLDWCDTAVLLFPAGKSGHLELGYVIGQGKQGYILLDAIAASPISKWDLMYRFAAGVFMHLPSLLTALQTERSTTSA